jgi:membrane protein DedA with SNARE-associated domain
VWVAAVVTAGLLVGGNLNSLISLVSRAGYIGLGLAIVLVVGFVVVHRLRRRRELREGERLLDGDADAGAREKSATD